MSHPILYTKTSHGVLQQWRVWSDGDQVFTEFGHQGGKLQTTPGKRCLPTNVGRVNARTAEEQAIFQAAAMHEHKLTRKYSETPEAAQAPVMLPMLATDVNKVKPRDLVFPAWAQIKYDGVRCIAQWDDSEPGGRISLMSRSGKDYFVPHVAIALRGVLPRGTVFDGELMLPGGSCQLTTSLVKNASHPDRGQLHYYVYDVPVHAGVDDKPWFERLEDLELILDPSGLAGDDTIVKVTSEVVNSMKEAQEAQQRYVADGQEGAILRLAHGLYEWGHRSRALLKVKSFDDREDVVIGARLGVGKMASACIFRCATADGKEYDVNMACTMEEKERYWAERDQYIGKKLTLRHFGLTDDGIPRFPTGRVFRDIKDLPTKESDD